MMERKHEETGHRNREARAAKTNKQLATLIITLTRTHLTYESQYIVFTHTAIAL